MPSNFNEFNRKLQRLQEAIPEAYKAGMKAAAKKIGEKIVEDATPIKTGRLANNWDASRNQSAKYERRAKGDKQSAQDNLDRAIDKVPLDDEKSKLYLNNPTPYAFKKLKHEQIKSSLRNPEVRDAVGEAIRKELGNKLKTNQ